MIDTTEANCAVDALPIGSELFEPAEVGTVEKSVSNVVTVVAGDVVEWNPVFGERGQHTRVDFGCESAVVSVVEQVTSVDDSVDISFHCDLCGPRERGDRIDPGSILFRVSGSADVRVANEQ